MEEDMRLVRWILLFPSAVLIGMIGSLGGGIVAIPFGQSAMDTSSAFFGPLAFVSAAGVIAPSHRSKITLGAGCKIFIPVERTALGQRPEIVEGLVG